MYNLQALPKKSWKLNKLSLWIILINQKYLWTSYIKPKKNFNLFSFIHYVFIYVKLNYVILSFAYYKYNIDKKVCILVWLVIECYFVLFIDILLKIII